MEEPRQASNVAQSANDEIKIFDLFYILAKNWKMIVCVPLAVAVITAVCTLFMPNVYTAKAMVLPMDDDGNALMSAMMSQMGGLAALAGGSLGTTTKADLYVTIMTSEAIKDPIIDRFKLMEVYQVKYRSKAYTKLGSNSDISVGKKDGVITVSVSDNDPQLAAAIANSYIDELGKFTSKLNMTGASANRVFLEDRLNKARVELAAAEDSLKTFQMTNRAVAVTDQAKATLEGVAMLRAQLAAQEIQFSTIRRQFTNESQEVKTAKETIASLRSQISRLEGKSEGSMPGVAAMPQLGQEYMRLMREFKIQEALVELLTKQYEVTKLNETKDLAPFQILQSAKVPELKSRPARSVAVIMAAFVSGFLMVLFSFIREFNTFMDSYNLQRLQEILRLLPLPRRFKDRGVSESP